MFIGVRKGKYGYIYIDKKIYSLKQDIPDEHGNITVLPLYTDEELSKPPYNYTKVYIDEIYADCTALDFNDDLTFSVEKYNARKEKESLVDYEEQVVELIRQRYNVNQELAILRQRDTKPEEFSLYNDYVEQCKAEVKAKLSKEVNA